jgi:3-phenylpropionate/trans-cinnamate dioxygenase ferredoxin subunit
LADLTVGPVEELPHGEVKIVRAGELAIGVYNLNGDYYAIEDRCSHDDGPLAEGDFDVDAGVAGRPLSLPAYQPVETFEVFVEDGLVKVRV